jgi:hypothetical protein
MCSINSSDEALGELLETKEQLEPETLTRLVSLVSKGRRDAALALRGREDAWLKLVQIFKETNEVEVTYTAEPALLNDHRDLSAQLIEPLSELLQTESCSDVAIKAVVDLLANQTTLPLHIVHKMNDYAEKHRETWETTPQKPRNFWHCLSMGDFCRNVNSFDEKTLK